MKMPLFRLVKSAAALLLVLAVPVHAAPTSVFFNEFHYDNTGTDTGEFIEIAGPAGTDLTGWSITLYNGANGLTYNTVALSGLLPQPAERLRDELIGASGERPAERLAGWHGAGRSRRHAASVSELRGVLRRNWWASKRIDERRRRRQRSQQYSCRRFAAVDGRGHGLRGFLLGIRGAQHGRRSQYRSDVRNRPLPYPPPRPLPFSESASSAWAYPVAAGSSRTRFTTDPLRRVFSLPRSLQRA